MLTHQNCETILDALRHAKAKVSDSQDNQATRHQTLENIESAEREVRAIHKALS